MKLFDLLKVELPSLKPVDCKIHLAGWNGRDDPLDIFLRGEFPEWQNWQSNRNFERPYIVSLIKLAATSAWVFAGVYSTHGCTSATHQTNRPWDTASGYAPTYEGQPVKSAVR